MIWAIKTDSRYWRIIGNIYGAAVVIGALLWYASAGEVWNWGLFFFSLVMLVYTPLSFRTVGPDERGTLLLFRKALWDAESGLVFAPLGFFRLMKDKKTIESIEVPADSRLIWHGEPEQMPANMVLPLRITTGIKAKVESALDNQQTVEVNYYVRFRVKSMTQFIQAFKNMDEFKKQVEDTSTRCLQTEYGQRTLARVIAEYGVLNGILRQTNEDLVSASGVEIVDTGIKHSSPGHTVNKALADVTASVLSRDATINKAEGDKQAKIKNGEAEASYKRNVGLADAEAEGAMLAAQNKGMKDALDSMDLSSEQASEIYRANLAADSMKHVKDIRIITGGNPMGSIFGLLTESAADIDRRRDGGGPASKPDNNPSRPQGPNKSGPHGGRPGTRPAPSGATRAPASPTTPAPAPATNPSPASSGGDPIPPITGAANI